MNDRTQKITVSLAHSWAGIFSFVVGVVFVGILVWSLAAPNLEDFFLAHFGDILVVSFVCLAISLASALVAIYGLLSKSKRLFSLAGLILCLASFLYFTNIVLQIFGD